MQAAPASPSLKGSEPLHIPSLDGLRAVSFFVVFLAHAGLERWVPGGFGVTVFFFLSGYLITTLLRLEHEKTGRISFKLFYLRRVLRILPPFYLVLFASALAVITGLAPGKIELGPFIAQALQYANYYIVGHGYEGMAPGTGVYWSLAVEEHFYLVFPALYVLLLGARMERSRHALVFVAICAAVLAWRCVLVWVFHAPQDRTYVATDCRIDSILWGSVLAVWNNPALDAPSKALERWYPIPLLLGAAGLLASFVLGNNRFGDPTFRETVRYTVQGVSLVPWFWYLVRFPNTPIAWVLNRRFVRKLGAYSYGLYLIHHVVLFILAHQFPDVSAFPLGVAGLAISFALAAAVFNWVEKPSAALRRRLSTETPT